MQRIFPNPFQTPFQVQVKRKSESKQKNPAPDVNKRNDIYLSLTRVRRDESEFFSFFFFEGGRNKRGVEQ